MGWGWRELVQRARAAEAELYNQGITFTIYSDGDAIDRILPFDVIPRLITAADWAVIEAGVRQRVQTLNLFLADVYGPQKVLKDGLIPPELVLGNANYRTEMQGLALPHGTYIHINGTDLVRDGAGPVPGARGQWPLAVGRVLRGREPPSDAARVLRRDARRAGAAGLRLWPPAAREAVRGGARGRARPAGGPALARRVQLGLFRACLPRPRDGRAAGRGPRPRGRERPGVHAHRRRARCRST